MCCQGATPVGCVVAAHAGRQARRGSPANAHLNALDPCVTSSQPLDPARETGVFTACVFPAAPPMCASVQRDFQVASAKRHLTSRPVGGRNVAKGSADWLKTESPRATARPATLEPTARQRCAARGS